MTLLHRRISLVPLFIALMVAAIPVAAQMCADPATFAPECGCANFRQDFTTPDALAKTWTYSGNPDAQPLIAEGTNAFTRDGQLVLSMKYNPAIQRGPIARVYTARWMKYGRFSARINLSAPAKGIPFTWIFKTNPTRDDVGDEIDFEWVNGQDQKQTQTNVFINGKIEYTRAFFYSFPDARITTGQFHVYTMVYQPEYIQWLIDDQVIRTLHKNGSDPFPNSPGRLYLSVWDTCASAPGTQKWAQGPSPYCDPNSPGGKDAVFEMLVDWIQVQCDSAGMPGPARTAKNSSTTPNSTSMAPLSSTMPMPSTQAGTAPDASSTPRNDHAGQDHPQSSSGSIMTGSAEPVHNLLALTFALFISLALL